MIKDVHVRKLYRLLAAGAQHRRGVTEDGHG